MIKKKEDESDGARSPYKDLSLEQRSSAGHLVEEVGAVIRSVMDVLPIGVINACLFQLLIGGEFMRRSGCRDSIKNSVALLVEENIDRVLDSFEKAKVKGNPSGSQTE